MDPKRKNWRSSGWCETHQKQTYSSQKTAKQVCRLHRGKHKVPYECAVNPGYYHIGDLSKWVIRGSISRDVPNRSEAEKS